MKKTILILGAILAIALIWAFAQYTTGEGARAEVSDTTGNVISNLNGEKVLISNENSEFEFEGYAVGKSHIGTFDEWQGYAYINQNELEGIEGIVQANSVNTGISGLDSHLQNEDFFEVETYPEIKFTSISISENEMTGNLLFRGVEKEITFPITKTDNSVAAEFFLDTTPFNFKYTAINEEVRIKFNFVY